LRDGDRLTRVEFERRWGAMPEVTKAELIEGVVHIPPALSIDHRAPHFDLVSCLYVHVAGSVGAMVRRLGAGVAPGGTLFLVGHRPVDPATGVPTPAAGQVQVSVDAAVDALDPREWQIVVAEERLRAAAGTGVDAVVRAIRRI